MVLDKTDVKNELVKLLTFTLMGIVSAAVDCAVYYLLLNFTPIDFRLIQPVSMTAGLSCSFIVNRFAVFRKEKRSLGKETVKYVIVCIVCISISPFIITLHAGWLGEQLGKIPATLTTGLINYILCRVFVYGNISGGKDKRN